MVVVLLLVVHSLSWKSVWDLPGNIMGVVVLTRMNIQVRIEIHRRRYLHIIELKVILSDWVVELHMRIWGGRLRSTAI